MLTGSAIQEAIKNGDIEIEPYGSVGTNSVDLRLDDELLVYNLMSSPALALMNMDPASYIGEDGKVAHRPNVLSVDVPNPTEKFKIGEEGAILLPGTLYLGATMERIHSDKYAATIYGRSSLGRLGIQVHQTAAFIDVGFNGVVTLEMSVIHPVRIWPRMRVAQVSFHPLTGEVTLYNGKYQGAREVQASRIHQDEENSNEGESKR